MLIPVVISVRNFGKYTKKTNTPMCLCFFCGKYKFEIEQINARFCRKCHRRIANVTKEYNKKGGPVGMDPFWLAMRKKHGKDWKIIMSQNLGNKR